MSKTTPTSKTVLIFIFFSSWTSRSISAFPDEIEIGNTPLFPWTGFLDAREHSRNQEIAHVFRDLHPRRVQSVSPQFSTRRSIRNPRLAGNCQNCQCLWRN